jgi:tetratricopeptide (TPR) repeat protein
MTFFTRLFKREAEDILKTPPQLVPGELPNPQTVADYLRRGWAYRALDQEEKAEQDFRAALGLEARSVDAAYALGMTLKAQGKKDQALAAFQQAVTLLDEGAEQDHDRQEMLHRLALGHINMISRGDWDLEREIWRRDQ